MDKIESREDYLEAILFLIRDGKNPKSIDVARRLNFSKPSVSIAMKKLREENLIVIDEKGFISLTPLGEEVANKTLEKHLFLKELFIKAGVDELTAENTACGIEHHINDDTFEKIRKFLNK